MDKFSMFLSAALTLTLLVLIAPNVLALNRGKMLRNIALWLAIVLALTIVYRTFGPGKDLSLQFQNNAAEESGDQPEADVPSGDQGYTPPRE